MNEIYQQIGAYPSAIKKAEAQGQHRTSVYVKADSIPVSIEYESRGAATAVYFLGCQHNIIEMLDSATIEQAGKTDELESLEFQVDVIWNGSNGVIEIADVFFAGTTESIMAMLHEPDLCDIRESVRFEVAL